MQLLPLDDQRWATYRSGFSRLPIDVSSVARRLAAGEADESVWSILWEDLHHQGDLGEAAYAIVPYLALYASQATELPWHVFGFPATVELERYNGRNPPLPPELELSYQWALRELPRVAATHPSKDWGEPVFECAAACFAISRGRRLLARAYLDFTNQEALRFLRDQIGYEPDERD